LPSEHLDLKGYYKCLEARDSAVGELCRHVSPELRSITLGSEDPKSILKAIKDTYGKSSLATRYNVLQALLAVKQESSEMIPAFISHAREALHYWQSTRPAVLSPVPTPVLQWNMGRGYNSCTDDTGVDRLRSCGCKS
jgi:hypothetical protein